MTVGEEGWLAGPFGLEPVSDRAGLRRLIGVTRQIYAGDPMWIQPLTFERLDHLNQAKNPFLREIEIRYWLAWRDDRPVGRISAQVNQRHLERHGDATGHFGFLEAFDDQELFAALTGTAEDWLREQRDAADRRARSACPSTTRAAFWSTASTTRPR